MKHFIESPAVLVDTGDLCGECPVWVPESQEVIGPTASVSIALLDWGARKYRPVAQGIEVYGFRANRAGGFVVTNTAGVWLWNVEGPLQPVATEVNGAAPATERLLRG